MKKTVFILLISFASSFVYSQGNSGGVVGIRIGNGSSGKVDVSTTDDETPMAGYIIYDSNDNVVQSGSLGSTSRESISVSSLPSGVYYFVVLSDTGDILSASYFKQ
jgi:hypothetical protein